MGKEERKKFIEQFAVQVEKLRTKPIQQFSTTIDQIRRERFKEETTTMQPDFGEYADGYRTFIEDLGPGFLEIAENYNMCIELAKNKCLKKGLFKDTKLSARIKDFSSCMRNSDTKILDDVFGMEVVTKDELEKEILILFNQIIFNIDKDKIYDKANGYKSYHCIGDLLLDSSKNLRAVIKGLIETKKSKVYRRSKDNPNYKDKRNMRSLFPELQEYIKDESHLDELTELFREMLEFMHTTDTSLQLPKIEFHFITSDVKENSLKGEAAHAKYKGADKKKIADKFKQGKLFRGINCPLKFNRNINRVKTSTFLSDNL